MLSERQVWMRLSNMFASMAKGECVDPHASRSIAVAVKKLNQAGLASHDVCVAVNCRLFLNPPEESSWRESGMSGQGRCSALAKHCQEMAFLCISDEEVHGDTDTSHMTGAQLSEFVLAARQQPCTCKTGPYCCRCTTLTLAKEVVRLRCELLSSFASS